MVRLGTLLRRSPREKDKPEEQPAPPAFRGPPLVVLIPDVGGVSSFRQYSFYDAEAATRFILSLSRQQRERVHAFWALQEEPAGVIDGDDTAGEATVLIRASEGSDLVYVVSFVDIDSAQSFARFEVKRGMHLSLMLVYWASMVNVVLTNDGVQLIPEFPPRIDGRRQRATGRSAESRKLPSHPELETAEEGPAVEPNGRQPALTQAGEAEEPGRLAAEAEEQRRLAAEVEEQRRLAAEAEEQRRLASETNEQQRLAAEAAEQRRLTAEAQEPQLLPAKTGEQQRLTAEADEQRRLQAKADEQRRRAAEAEEQQRIAAAVEEQHRIAAEGQQRRRLEAEAEEQRRISAAEEERRLAAQSEEQRQREAEAQEQQRVAAEAEQQRRLAAEAQEQRHREAEAHEHQRVATEAEQQRRLAAEAEEQQRRVEAEAEKQRRLAAQAEEWRRQAEAEERQRELGEVEERQRELAESEERALLAEAEERLRKAAEAQAERERVTEAEMQRLREAMKQEQRRTEVQAQSEHPGDATIDSPIDREPEEALATTGAFQQSDEVADASSQPAVEPRNPIEDLLKQEAAARVHIPSEFAKDPPAGIPEALDEDDPTIADEVGKILRRRRWEKRESPFEGFNSPPGRF